MYSLDFLPVNRIFRHKVVVNLTTPKSAVQVKIPSVDFLTRINI